MYERNDGEGNNMSISRRQFILGTAAGLNLPWYFDTAFASHESTDETLITVERLDHDFVRFDEIYLKDYGIFSGSHSFSFNEGTTVIASGNGCGKTTVFNALARLGPDPAVRPNRYSKTPDLSVEVVTRGNRDLITKYHSLIFDDGESVSMLANYPDKAATDLCYGQSSTAIKDAAWDRLTYLLKWDSVYESGPYPRLEESLGWSLNEKTLYGWALVVAARDQLKMDLPLVLEIPDYHLEIRFRKALAELLDTLPGQQIHLISSYFIDHRQHADYRLAGIEHLHVNETSST